MMLTDEWVVTLGPGSTGLAALRWSVAPSTPALIAEELRERSVATKLFDRVAAHDSPRLLPLLVELAGDPLDPIADLDDEARALRTWFLLVERDGRWALPVDLAVAMMPRARVFRFAAATLVARLPLAARDALAEELGASTWGSVPARVARIAARIGPNRARATREAAANTARIADTPIDSLGDVAVVQGSAGTLFDVVIGGTVQRVAPREIARALGHAFAPPSIPPRATERPNPHVPPAPPRVLPSAALVTFSSATACDEALRSADLQDLVLRRIGERHIALVPQADVTRVEALLRQLGFALVAPEPRPNEVRFASR